MGAVSGQSSKEAKPDDSADISLDDKEQIARINKLQAETRLTEIQSRLYPLALIAGALLGVAAIARLFV